jgi:gamma-aminobutyric acid type B receptor
MLKQIQNGSEFKVGEYSSLHRRLDLSMGVPMKWGGRSPPKDRTLIQVTLSQINITIYAVLASCAVLGIVMASVFLFFNIKYRNQR